mgnify:CR=1 FL=1
MQKDRWAEEKCMWLQDIKRLEWEPVGAVVWKCRYASRLQRQGKCCYEWKVKGWTVGCNGFFVCAVYSWQRRDQRMSGWLFVVSHKRPRQMRRYRLLRPGSVGWSFWWQWAFVHGYLRWISVVVNVWCKSNWHQKCCTCTFTETRKLAKKSAICGYMQCKSQLDM